MCLDKTMFFVEDELNFNCVRDLKYTTKEEEAALNSAVPVMLKWLRRNYTINLIETYSDRSLSNRNGTIWRRILGLELDVGLGLELGLGLGLGLRLELGLGSGLELELEFGTNASLRTANIRRQNVPYPSQMRIEAMFLICC